MKKLMHLMRTWLTKMSQVIFLISLLISSHIAMPVASAGDVLKTEAGAPLKVIALHDTAAFAEPNTSSRSTAIRQFEFFFVLPASEAGEKTKNGFYRVSTASNEASLVGWIEANACLEWPHIQCLGFARNPEREKVHFFESASDVQAYLQKGDVTAAISREPSGTDVLQLLPIIAESRIETNGEVVTLYELGYAHSGSTENVGLTQSHQSVSLKDVQDNFTLNVCFVLDSTESMTKPIILARQVISKIAKAVKADVRLKDRVALALVCYRDKGDFYTSKIFCDYKEGTDLAVFERKLASVTVDGGGDIPEQMNSGLMTAIKDVSWPQYGNKHIILITDAPSHEGENLIVSTDSVLSAAQPGASSNDVQGLFKHITMHTMFVGDPTTPHAELAKKQLVKIAAGREHSGLSATMESEEGFVSQLTDLLMKRVRDTAVVVDGKADEMAELTKDPNAGSIVPILEQLRGDQVVGTSFKRGFAAEIDREGNRSLEPYILAAQNDIKAFQAALAFCVTTLRSAGEPGAKDINRILTSLKTLSVHLNIDSEINGGTTLKDILSELILALPIKTRVLDLTIDQIAGMSQSEFDSWVQEVESCAETLKGLISSGRWFNLGTEKRADYRYAFIRMADLP
jgi:hypothetical protein